MTDENPIDRNALENSDGQDGRPAYIAWQGKVYDVSESRLWKGGSHMSLHKAGQDLTAHMPMAPHGPEVLDRVAAVGVLAEPTEDEVDQREELKESLSSLYKKYHPHPITIHFPIALFIFAGFLDASYLLLGRPVSLGSAVLYSLLFASFTAPAAMASGFLSWWLNYNMALTDIFRRKIAGSLLLLIVAAICLALRLDDPGVQTAQGAASWVYHALLLAAVPLVGFIGYQGGKITFPG